jgi:rubrerythrin
MFVPLAARSFYVCRGCGTSVSYPGTFRKCPVCGIKWG